MKIEEYFKNNDSDYLTNNQAIEMLTNISKNYSEYDDNKEIVLYSLT